MAKLSSYGKITHIRIDTLGTIVGYGAYVKFTNPPDEARVISQWNYNQPGSWSMVAYIVYVDYSFRPEDAVNSNLVYPIQPQLHYLNLHHPQNLALHLQNQLKDR